MESYWRFGLRFFFCGMWGIGGLGQAPTIVIEIAIEIAIEIDIAIESAAM